MLTLYKKSDAYEPFSITPQHPDAQNLLYMAVLEAFACVWVCVHVCERERAQASTRVTKSERQTAVVLMQVFLFFSLHSWTLHPDANDSPNTSKTATSDTDLNRCKIFQIQRKWKYSIWHPSIHFLPRESQFSHQKSSFIPYLLTLFRKKATWILAKIIEHIRSDKLCSKLIC